MQLVLLPGDETIARESNPCRAVRPASKPRRVAHNICRERFGGKSFVLLRFSQCVDVGERRENLQRARALHMPHCMAPMPHCMAQVCVSAKKQKDIKEWLEARKMEGSSLTKRILVLSGPSGEF